MNNSECTAAEVGLMENGIKLEVDRAKSRCFRKTVRRGLQCNRQLYTAVFLEHKKVIQTEHSELFANNAAV